MRGLEHAAIAEQRIEDAGEATGERAVGLEGPSAGLKCKQTRRPHPSHRVFAVMARAHSDRRTLAKVCTARNSGCASRKVRSGLNSGFFACVNASQ